MIPDQAIRKAMQGGWGANAYAVAEDIPFEKWTKAEYCEVALSPSFWQALEKSLDLSKTSHNSRKMRWMNTAHAFYDLILTGGSTDEFWEEILK